jgi:hypothetical protein
MAEAGTSVKLRGPGALGPWEIRPARPEDVDVLAPKLREMDQRELWALSGHTPIEGLHNALKLSVRALTAVIEGRVGMMWGVAPCGGILGLIGVPWMLAADIIERPDITREFIRQSRPYAQDLEVGFCRLENLVHAENRLTIRWLKWLGFIFAERTETFNSEKFYRFWKEL